MKHGRYKDALTLAQSFYEGKAKGVVGLAGGVQRRKSVVSESVCKIIVYNLYRYNRFLLCSILVPIRLNTIVSGISIYGILQGIPFSFFLLNTT